MYFCFDTAKFRFFCNFIYNKCFEHGCTEKSWKLPSFHVASVITRWIYKVILIVHVAPRVIRHEFHFHISTISYRSGNNCPLVYVSLRLYLALSSFCNSLNEITRRTLGITVLARHNCLCLTAKKSTCTLKCKQSFTEQAIYIASQLY